MIGLSIQKSAYFDEHWGDGWPSLENIKYRLIDVSGRSKFFEKGLDGGSFFIETSGSAERAQRDGAVFKAGLYVHMHPLHGVKLQHSMSSNRISRTSHHSKGDFSRLRDFVRSFHDTPLSLGLFIPFEPGWRAVEEFIRTEGKLPTAISWLADDDLPPETFPLP